ncbi:sensor histidine kinase [Pseudodesulfovibrio senegalensis]|uniref:histidine kinase n=1 Tax=Pseudodesulfovibrio senegalensis TaxID=1721087 RepID=A0A6N6N5T0_9BACT|nr:sensor histidine kinase [Pseudodesulfovibrio senegalensis]KAB1442845.1 sensor histidine kinase [Pseudodesulfovibrio senegalensis]
MQVREKGSYHKLSRNMVFTVVTVSMAPLILVGGLIFNHFRSIYHEKVYALLVEVVGKHTATVDTFLHEKLSEVQFLNRAFSFDQLSDNVFLEKTLRDIQQQYGLIFVDLGIIDESGRQIAYAGPFDLLGADYSKADWYLESRGKVSVISDVFLGLRRSPHFIIAANAVAGGKQWTLRATIDFLAFSNLVESIRIGETGHAYILNRSGVFQTKPPAGRSSSFTLAPVESIVPEALGAGIRMNRSKGSDDAYYIIVSSSLKGGDWRLVYQQKWNDAFSAMNRSEFFTLAIFLLGGLGIVGMAVVMSRKLMARFKSIDREAELMNKQMVEAGKLASIGELAAGIAHEINNPVAIMIEEAGWVGDLLEDEQKQLSCSDEVARALRQVRTQGQRCKDITHKLLSFARQTDSEASDVSIAPLIEEVVNLSMQQARFAKVNFNLDLEDMPRVRASVSELQQVFLNLVNNSIQAMEPEGGELSLSCMAAGPWAVINVQDTGPGIPEANLDRVFDPFFTTKPVGKGSGLGLSICYGIIRRMGGEIDVESSAGKGARFTIRLPFASSGQRENQTKAVHHD